MLDARGPRSIAREGIRLVGIALSAICPTTAAA
jgi:hypothetical protein